MISLTAQDITQAFEEIVDLLLWTPERVVDLTKSPSIYTYDNLIRAQSCEFSFDLSWIGLTKNRWARFLTQYVNKQALESWLQSIEEQRGRGVVNLLRSTGETDVTPAPGHPEWKGHRWGVCFLGVSFLMTPKPKLTLYSRMARIPTTAVMELTLVSLLAKEIQERYQIEAPIQLTWFCSAIHVTAWDIMPYLVSQNKMTDFLSSDKPLAKYVARQYEKAMTLPLTKEAIPYGRQRRISRRVRELEEGNPLPSCQVSKLSLWVGRT